MSKQVFNKHARKYGLRLMPGGTLKIVDRRGNTIRHRGARLLPETKQGEASKAMRSGTSDDRAKWNDYVIKW